jgi:CRISPR/Cas system-associated protein Csm6
MRPRIFGVPVCPRACQAQVRARLPSSSSSDSARLCVGAGHLETPCCRTSLKIVKNQMGESGHVHTARQGPSLRSVVTVHESFGGRYRGISALARKVR